MGNFKKLSVNVSEEDREDLDRLAAMSTLKGKKTCGSDLVRKFIKEGIEKEKQKNR